MSYVYFIRHHLQDVISKTAKHSRTGEGRVVIICLLKVHQLDILAKFR